MNKFFNFDHCSECEENDPAFCCGLPGQMDKPLLTNKERKVFRRKYGDCFDQKGDLNRDSNGKCIFLTSTGCKLSIKDRPFECLLFPIHVEKDKNGDTLYILETHCIHAKELIKEIQKVKSSIKFRKYCKKCEWQCCTHEIEEGAHLSNVEQKNFKKKYGDCFNKDGYVNVVDPKTESVCVFFNQNKHKCKLSRKNRPIECLLYPFNYIKSKKTHKRTAYDLDMECLIAQQIVKELVSRK